MSDDRKTNLKRKTQSRVEARKRARQELFEKQKSKPVAVNNADDLERIINLFGVDSDVTQTATAKWVGKLAADRNINGVVRRDKNTSDFVYNQDFLQTLDKRDRILIEQIIRRKNDVARPTAPEDLNNETFSKTYRQASELPNPERPSWVEENRPNKRIDFRLSEALLNEINHAARDGGIERGEWLIDTIKKFLSKHPDNAPPLAPSGSAKVCALRLDDDLLREIDEAAAKVHMKRAAWMKAVCHFMIHKPSAITVASFD